MRKWEAVESWQHMRWIVMEGDEEIAHLFGEHARERCERIVADHNGAAEREAGLVAVLKQFVNERGHLRWCNAVASVHESPWCLDVCQQTRAALAATAPQDAREGGHGE